MRRRPQFVVQPWMRPCGDPTCPDQWCRYEEAFERDLDRWERETFPDPDDRDYPAGHERADR